MVSSSFLSPWIGVIRRSAIWPGARSFSGVGKIGDVCISSIWAFNSSSALKFESHWERWRSADLMKEPDSSDSLASTTFFSRFSNFLQRMLCFSSLPPPDLTRRLLLLHAGNGPQFLVVAEGEVILADRDSRREGKGELLPRHCQWLAKSQTLVNRSFHLQQPRSLQRSHFLPSHSQLLISDFWNMNCKDAFTFSCFFQSCLIMQQQQ